MKTKTFLLLLVVFGSLAYLNISRAFYGGTPQIIPSAVVTGSSTMGYIVLTGSTPAVATSSGAGTGATASIVGTMNGGVITLTTGSAPSGSAVVLTITNSVVCPNGFSPVISGGNLSAGQLAALTGVFASSTSNSTWVIKSTTSGLGGSTVFVFNYAMTCW